MLIPEISLTYQTLARFRKHFGTRVAFVNSKQSKGEKYEQFRKAKEGEVDVVIGPRSALFTPFPNLKLLVMDEEHDPAFKSDQHRGIMQETWQSSVQSWKKPVSFSVRRPRVSRAMRGQKPDNTGYGN